MVAVEIANVPFATRDAGLWEAGSTEVASGSTQFILSPAPITRTPRSTRA